MRNLFIAECIKLKRKKILLLILVAVAIEAIMIVNRLLSPDYQFIDLYIQDFQPITMGIHTIIIYLIGISIFYDEYKNKTISYVATAPVSPAKFILSKMMIIGALSILQMIVTSVFFGIAFIISSGENSIHLLGFVLFHLLVSSITFTITLVPIMLIIVVLKGNALFSILTTVLYSGIVVIKSGGYFIGNSVVEWLLEYLHPLGNAVLISSRLFQKIVYQFVPNPEIYGMTPVNIDWLLSIGFLIGVSLLCICISIALLKRQNYEL